MRLRSLHLEAFGPFTRRVLDFRPPADGGLFLMVGPNEAGKSSTLRAMCDLRYGIPLQSDDDFVHDKPAMCVGGVFVAADGRPLSLMRRKKNKASLTLHDADDLGFADGVPAPAEIEVLLAGAMDRSEYLQMYALDHARLREGGAALASGQGDVGAALFEASAGVGSVATLLAQLDEQAKSHYNGSRGKNARIAVALAAYKAHGERHRGLLIRPDAWASRERDSRQAAQKLDAIRETLKSTRARQLLLRELRAVEPLLASLRAIRLELADVGQAVLLDASAASMRIARETELASACDDARRDRARAVAIEDEIAALVLDEPCLRVAAAIGRLVALQEHVDDALRDVRGAVDVEREAATALDDAARAIAPERTPAQLLALVPTPLQRSELESVLDGVDGATLLLRQVDAIARVPAAADEEEPPEPPPLELAAALRDVLDDVAGLKDKLARLDALPRELQAAARRLDAMRAALAIDADGLERARPLLDHVIDEAATDAQRAETRIAGLRERIEQIDIAIDKENAALDALKAGGEVPTPDEVAAARRRRDSGWTLVRSRLDGVAPDDAAFAAFSPTPQALPDAYEQAVRKADQLSDEMGRDAQRAARLQALRRDIDRLHADRDKLVQETDALALDRRSAAVAWADRLAGAGLPALAPAALRQWQAQLQAARGAAEALHALGDEQSEALARKAEVRAALVAAIVATGVAEISPQAELPAAERIARQVCEEIAHRESAIQKARAAVDERARQQARLDAQRAGAQAELAAFATVLAQASPSLLLAERNTAPETTAQLARARLREFEALASARKSLAEAGLRLARQRDVLQAHVTQAGAVAKALHEPEPEADALRLFIDRIDARLQAAIATRDALLARQRLLAATRDAVAAHEAKASSARVALDALCEAAGVAAPADLPLAEERSAARRGAELRRAECEGQIAKASSRPVDELEALLASEDLATLPAEQGEVAAEIERLEAIESEARRVEETARRALEMIDGGDAAADARESMEMAAAAVRASMPAWIRTRLAHALLQEATRRFRERAQGPMLQAASGYFTEMTGGDFVGLESDDSDARPTLLGRRASGAAVPIQGMSEGTRDQLFLALRLAALELARDGRPEMPVTLDDVLITSDDARAAAMIRALHRFSRGSQVMVFTHHRHLVDVAAKAIDGRLSLIEL